MENEKENFFDKFGLEIASGDVEVGSTYPIYGMITKIICDEPGAVVVEVNFNILAHMAVPDREKIETLRQRAFEPGIFVSTITSKEAGNDGKQIEVDCNTVVFGRKQLTQEN